MGLVLRLALISSLGVTAVSANYPLSDHYDGKHFFNKAPIEHRNFIDLLRWMMEGGKKKWPEKVENKASPQFPQGVDKHDIHVTYVNHASFFIQYGGLNILTDPIFSERASPVSFAGPKRVRIPGVALEQLPQVHYVIVSHNHYDHLDIPSLKDLNRKFHPQFLVPLGDAQLLKSEGIENVVELDWWQSFVLQGRGEIQLVPCQHWSARGLFDRFESLWGAYLIKIDAVKIVFVGDAGYSDDFKSLYKKVGAIDLSIIPIGAYEPRWFMKAFHMNPDEAVQAHLDMQSRYSLASHFGTFQLTNEGIDDPPKDLRESLKNRGLSSESFPVLEVGQTKSFNLK